ncbi:MAG: hypothetical protein SGJ02_00145 [bacterium]|nr:hypothetical protein [bacterium]
MFSIILLGSGCYYGPGVDHASTEALRRSARDLNPYPVIMERSNALGQDYVSGALDQTLTPLIMGDEKDPEISKENNYQENMRRQQEAMDEMDRQLDEINKKDSKK